MKGNDWPPSKRRRSRKKPRGRLDLPAEDSKNWTKNSRLNKQSGSKKTEYSEKEITERLRLKRIASLTSRKQLRPVRVARI